MKRTISGRDFAVKIPARFEEAVDDYVATASDVRAGELAIASELAASGLPDGDAFSWIRRSLGMTARQLASILDVRHETISRWENGASPVDRTAWLVLGDLVLDAVGRHVPMIDRTTRIAAGTRPKARTVVSIEPAPATKRRATPRSSSSAAKKAAPARRAR